MVGLWAITFAGSKWRYRILADGHALLSAPDGTVVGRGEFVLEGQNLRFLTRTDDCPQDLELGYYEVYVTKRGDQSEQLRFVLVGYDCFDRKTAFNTPLVPWQ